MSTKKHLIKKVIHKAKESESDHFGKLVIVLAILGVAIIGVYVASLGRIQNDDITMVLPAQETAAFVEVDGLSLPTKLVGAPGFGKGLWVSALSSLTNLPQEAITKVWDKGSFGVALMLTKSNVSHPIFFAEVSSRRKVIRDMEGLGLPNEKPVTDAPGRQAVYSFPQGQSFHFTFSGPFIIMSTDKDILSAMQVEDVEAVSIAMAQEDYQKTAAQLPRSSWVRGYANVHNVYLKDRFLINNVVEPLKFAMNHAAFTIRQNPNGFHFNTFVSLNKKLLSLNGGRLVQSKFAHRLTDVIPAEELGMYFGGENLSDEWQNTLSTIANLNPAYGIILESILRAQVTKIFGEDVDMRTDIYPLFEGEYGLVLTPRPEGGNTISLILSHNDKEFTQIKMAKLLDGFRLLANEFTPKIHTVELPDGTQSKELVASEERPEEKVEKVGDSEVHCVEVEDSPNAFCYAITSNLLMMGNSRKNVEGALSLSVGGEGSLSDFQPFRSTLNSVSKVTDEISFISVPKILPLTAKHPYGLLAQPFLENFDAFAWVKHYFEDGVSAEGYLLLK